MNRKIEITVITLTPWHVACGVSGPAYINAEGNIVSGQAKGVTPVARTERKPCSVRSKNGEGQVIQFYPVLRANGIVGRLRRYAQDVIVEAYISQGKVMSDKTYRGLSCGSPFGTPSSESPMLAEFRNAAKNLFIGVFGGGSKIFPSGIRSSDLDVVHMDFIDLGMIPEKFRSTAVDYPSSRLTYPVSLTKRDRMSEFTDPNMAEVVEGGDTAIINWCDLLESEKKKTSEGGKRAMLRNKVAYEAMLSGLPMYGSIRLSDGLADAQIGLLIEGLVRLAENNGLGGKTSKEMGRFNMSVALDGETIFNSFNGIIEKNGIDRYSSALHDAIEELDTEEMDSYFKQTTFDAKEKADSADAEV